MDFFNGAPKAQTLVRHKRAPLESFRWRTNGAAPWFYSRAPSGNGANGDEVS